MWWTLLIEEKNWHNKEKDMGKIKCKKERNEDEKGRKREKLIVSGKGVSKTSRVREIHTNSFIARKILKRKGSPTVRDLINSRLASEAEKERERERHGEIEMLPTKLEI